MLQGGLVRRCLSSLGALLITSGVCWSQAIIHVPGDKPTIQAAIHAAVDGDIVIVAPGTYVELIDYLGKAITVMSSGGAESTIIDSNAMDYWMNWPYAPVVRFVNGEGPGSILNGFTITGHDYIGASPSAPIYCYGLSPTILNCIVRDNHGGRAGGIYGNAHIEGCLITNNASEPGGDGGGISGIPTVINCIVTNNYSWEGSGGGINVEAECDIIDCVITGNLAGTDGRHGGGVRGPANLLRCIIADNTVNHWGGTIMDVGAGVDGATSITSCAIIDNVISDAYAGLPGGGVTNSQNIVNSIIWGNDENQLGSGVTGTVTYNCIQGGYAGTGNISSDPMFVDYAGGDYALQLGSPCIDTGDPTTQDDDETRADMGAVFFPQYQAYVEVRIGTLVNPIWYAFVSPPEIGTIWTAQVDTSSYGGTATLTVLFGYEGASSPIATPMGEILIDPTSALLLLSFAAPSPTIGHHLQNIPLDYTFVGFPLYTQAAVVGSGIRLCNGWDLHFGL